MQMFSLLSQNIPTPVDSEKKSADDKPKKGFDNPIIACSKKIFQEYVLSGLIWVKAVCKSYQQTTLRDKELKD